MLFKYLFLSFYKVIFICHYFYTHALEEFFCFFKFLTISLEHDKCVAVSCLNCPLVCHDFE